MKMTKNSILRKVILLLTFTMMLALVAATAVLAAGDPPQTLTFNFDPQKCTVRLESPQLDEPVNMENGKPVEIPNGAYVKVTVTPKLGYTIADIKDASTNASLTKQDPTVYTAEFFTSSVEAKVECTTKVFSVVFEVGDVLYDLVDSTWEDWRNVKYHYMQPNQITVLPIVARKGYTFEGWYLINSNGEVLGALPQYNENGDTNGENQYRYYISPDMPITDEINTSGTVYLHAEFTPNPQPVIRYDQVTKFNETTQKWVDGKVLNGNGYEWKAPTGASVSGLTFVSGNDVESDDPENPYLNYFSYPGYRLVTDLSRYPSTPIMPADEDNPYPNTRYRYYTPIVYTLVYNLDGGAYQEGVVYPTTYTYEEFTRLVQPTRRGYTFSGWEIKVNGEVVNTNTGIDFILGNLDTASNALYAADDERIELRAIWTPNTYDIIYNWNVPAELEDAMNEWNANLPTTFTFDTSDFFINHPFRKGYTFEGWTLACECTDHADGFGDVNGLTPDEGKTWLNCTAHTANITLTASWKKESYEVTLNGQGAADGFTNKIPSVTYDDEWSLPDNFVLPKREGFTFDGYWSADDGGEKYINADGTINVTVWGLDDAGTPGEITLYARWIRNSYSITVNISGLPTDVNATIQIQVGENTFYPNGKELPFETEYKIIITMPAGHMLVAWNGENHSTGLSRFESGILTVGAAAQTWEANSQPAAPVYGNGFEIDKNSGSTDTQIKVQMPSDVAHLYEFAILENNNDPGVLTDADWKQITGDQNYYLFEDLKPGTPYYVFVRLQEDTENGVPSGIIYVHSTITTTNTAYLNEINNRLDNMLTDQDGDVANAVIDDIKEQIGKLDGKDNFYDLVEELLATVEAQLAFARVKDAKIAELEAFREACESSGLFNDVNLDKLREICTKAVTAIRTGCIEETQEKLDTEEKIVNCYNTAMAAMKAVPVSYLYDASGIIKLTSTLGLAQNSGIAINSVQDIKELRRAIADAIAAGKITADSFITIDEAAKILNALDTVAAYNLYLIDVLPTAGDTFMLTMTIPEALAGRTGLQVAYYNAATGVVELLKTEQEGNTLVFYAKSIGDFVILADPTVDLTPVLLVLSAIVLCQLIAIALVLVSRSKGKNAVKHASVALPMFMTIYFLPHNAELIALGLVATIVVLQIILMWLLLSSGMIRTFKTKKPAPRKQEIPATVREEDLQPEAETVADEEPIAEEPTEDVVSEQPINDEVVEESYEESYTEVLAEDAFDEDLARELALEQDEFVDEEQVIEEALPEETEEIYDDEEFIEPAPTPYYSLDDQEDVFAYDNEAEFGEADVQGTSEEGEASYDADPFGEVFGDAPAQDDGSEYSGGTDLYSRSGEEYLEYDAEETDAYEDGTEAIVGEETEGQGTVDPYAYVVEDDGEEISDDEEMYRYDE